MPKPSTEWKERIAPGEAERYAAHARDFAALQAAKSARYGTGRALHRKAQLGLAAEFEVLPDLPPHARQGLFAAPGRHPAWVRLSNGGADRQSDRQPDIRGFSIKVRGLSGPGALGGDTDSQDFLLINQAAFAFPGSEEFVGLALNAVNGPVALLKYLIGRYGLLRGLGHAKRLAGVLGRPFTGFASETFHSAAPIACGPYAAKVRLLPASQEPSRHHPPDWAGDMRDRLTAGDLVYDVQLLFFTGEAETPIEDASKEWTDDIAPAVTVARLRIPAQDTESPAGKALARQIEEAAFDPWRALAAHRPLGDVMRARKVVYFASQQGRAT